MPERSPSSGPRPRPDPATALDPTRFWPRLRAALAGVPERARTPPAEARVGAVLILVEETSGGPVVVLTRRRRDLRSHPGQLSFPGGRREPGETLERSALREAREEIGLDPASVEVVGTGPTFYIPPSRFWVAPVLARWRAPHELAENPWEVDAILRVPLAHLLDPARWRHTPLSMEGSTWAWQLEDDLLWGATAAVLSVLLDTAVPDWHGGLEPAALGEGLAVRPWERVPAAPRRPRLEGDLPTLARAEVPHVTAAQIRAVRAWLDRHGVGPGARAEQAGRALAHAARRLLDRPLTEVRATVLAGPSSNGTAGLVAARLLLAAGAEVDVRTLGPMRAPMQVRLLAAAGAEVTEVVGPDGDVGGPAGDIVLDCLLGVGTTPPIAELPARAARWLRRHDVPAVALELPSGMGADVGLQGPCVTADVTVALGLPLVGLRSPIAHAYVGDLYLADLGVPPAAWRAAGVDVPATAPFARGPLVRLAADDTAGDAGTPDQAVPAG
ncbi:MAG: NAD(P)H-hydrate epimerase [Nitriliruptoraceae bacterium]